MQNFKIDVKNDIHYIYFPVFWEKNTIVATSLRLGGKSLKPYESLNTGLHTDDKYENVIENRKRFFKILGINYKNIVTLKQVHSNKVIKITKEHRGRGALKFEESVDEADAMITSEYNLPLVVFTADCMPIFFLEPERRIAAIAHSGWRGSLNNIASKVVNEIVKNGGKAKNIIVGLGPAIRDCCYEVREDVYSLFDERFITKRDNRYFLDIYKINIENLINSGIKQENIYSTNFCTYCNINFCFSYRREGETGRMASVIMLCQ